MLFLDTRVSGTVRIVDLAKSFARTNKISPLREQANTLNYYLMSNEARPQRVEGVIRELKAFVPRLEATVKRIRTPAKVESAKSILAVFREEIPELISHWENFSEMKQAIADIDRSLEFLNRYDCRTEEFNIAVKEAHLFAKELMSLKIVEHETIKQLFGLIEIADKAMLEDNLGNPYFVNSGQYLIFKKAVIDLEISSLLECS